MLVLNLVYRALARFLIKRCNICKHVIVDFVDDCYVYVNCVVEVGYECSLYYYCV